MLNFLCVNKRMVNTLSVIVCNYLACIWFNRENMEFIEKKKIRAKVIKERNFIRYTLKENLNKFFCQ